MSEVYSSADDAVSYGDGFKAVRRLQAGEREAIAELTLSHEVDSAHGGALHPALWDSSLQPLAYLVAKTAAAANLQATMHTGYAEVIVHRSALTPLFSYAVLADESKGTGEITGDVKIFTSDGDLVAEMKGVRYKVLAKDDELSTTAHHIPSTPARADAVLERLRSARSREDGVAAFSAYLVKVMATLLPEGTREITPTTNFADAGLDSLRAIEIRNRISNEIGITISLVDFLREATIERLASRCWTLHFAPKEEDHEEIIL